MQTLSEMALNTYQFSGFSTSRLHIAQNNSLQMCFIIINILLKNYLRSTNANVLVGLIFNFSIKQIRLIEFSVIHTHIYVKNVGHERGKIRVKEFHPEERNSEVSPA